MQIYCSFTSVILAGQYDHKTTLMHHKNVFKKTRPHSWMLRGRVVHKWYSSRYLAVHNHTTNGFHVAFEFQWLLGSTLYLSFMGMCTIA